MWAARVTELRTAEARCRHLIDATAAYEQLPGFSFKGDTFTPGEFVGGPFGDFHVDLGAEAVAHRQTRSPALAAEAR